eukprot:scaffold93492_cov40-Tisochrysis_lutea.AAC.2
MAENSTESWFMTSGRQWIIHESAKAGLARANYPTLLLVSMLSGPAGSTAAPPMPSGACQNHASSNCIRCAFLASGLSQRCRTRAARGTQRVILLAESLLRIGGV